MDDVEIAVGEAFDRVEIGFSWKRLPPQPNRPGLRAWQKLGRVQDSAVEANDTAANRATSLRERYNWVTLGAYKRYINPKEPGITCFVTATCLDFAHLFQRDEIKTQMCLSLLDDCIRRRAKVKGFVAMIHHIHLLIRPNDAENISQLMQPLKENAADRIIPLLNESERGQLAMQSGLSRRTFWKRSFRANPMSTQPVLQQKLHYLHENPVRASICESAEEYLWSSAHLRQFGWLNEDGTINLRLASEFYDAIS